MKYEPRQKVYGERGSDASNHDKALAEFDKITGGMMQPTEHNKYESFKRAIEMAVNQYSLESGSDTPDFILAEFLTDCLRAFDEAVQSRHSMKCKNARYIK